MSKTIKVNVVVVYGKRAVTGEIIKIANTFTDAKDLNRILEVFADGKGCPLYETFYQCAAPVIEGGSSDGQYDLSKWEK